MSSSTPTLSNSQYSTKVDNESPKKPSFEPKERKNMFSRLKKKEEEPPLPQWKIAQQKRFKEWEKARDKQTSSVGAFTDFYKPRKDNKGFWIWWL
ncbi:hypothetical protein CERZMDRAFT_95425 [Cercospora zeae-maydis SCOH1-5]|uniref:Uncharacterized protein n=1 Tax=Cercospora zeae-maydis SCOH1-5 TaxID=717836 RepID=A0A6A6FNM5_9PEZI|nr:hypothetical protein CERZMDRAFT_95425 [Cercospora zeae-maydis SCOH1-5]